jgi:hypothetical protein
MNQMKEGDEPAGHRVNIGLHYVAVTNSQPSTINYQPIDSDGDGIPDYVENWHGDGNYSLHTDSETDWRNPVTDGVTNDIYNTVYDDVDLSGDGLTGRAKRILGINPLSTENPLNLSPILQQSTLSGIVQIPLNIGTNVDTNSVIQLFVDGVEANATVYQTNGTWFAEWDTMTTTNMQHFVSLSLTFCADDAHTRRVCGGAQLVAVTNAITVEEIRRWFTDRLVIDAQVNVAASQYQIAVYDAQTQILLTNLTGNVSGGRITTSWNLQDGNGNRVVNGPLRCDFYLTSSQLSAQAQSLGMLANNAPSGYPSATVNYKFIHHITGQAFTIAYGYDYSSQSKIDALQDMILDAAVDNLNTLCDFYEDVYGGGYDYNLLPTGPGGNVPFVSAWQFLNNWDYSDQLYDALTGGASANFYWWGHCNVDNISPISHNPGGGTAPNVDASTLSSRLHNNVSAGVINNPFRLVILDACSGYSKLWADAFGIIYQVNGSSWTVADYDNFGIDRQAFVAWTVDTPAPNTVTGIQEWQQALDVLFAQWQLGKPLNYCMSAYTTTLLNEGFTQDGDYPFGTHLGTGDGIPDVKEYKISGCINLTTFDR